MNTSINEIFNRDLVEMDIKNTFPTLKQLKAEKTDYDINCCIGVRFLNKKGFSEIFPYMYLSKDKETFNVEEAKEMVIKAQNNEEELRNWIKFNVSSRASKQAELFDMVFSFGFKDQPVYKVKDFK